MLKIPSVIFVIPLALLSHPIHCFTFISSYQKIVKNQNCSNFHQIDTENSHEQGLSKNVFFTDTFLYLIRRESCARFWKGKIADDLLKKNQQKSYK